MKSQEIGIKPTLHVVLAADNQMLDEVMVVAYGTAKKSSFTGAASSVNAEKVLKDVPVTSFEQALQGATTGLSIRRQRQMCIRDRRNNWSDRKFEQWTAWCRFKHSYSWNRFYERHK
mgnify:CR=1 FL=1